MKTGRGKAEERAEEDTTGDEDTPGMGTTESSEEEDCDDNCEHIGLTAEGILGSTKDKENAAEKGKAMEKEDKGHRTLVLLNFLKSINVGILLKLKNIQTVTTDNEEDKNENGPLVNTTDKEGSSHLQKETTYKIKALSTENRQTWITDRGYNQGKRPFQSRRYKRGRNESTERDQRKRPRIEHKRLS